MERREYYFLDSFFLPYYAGGIMVFKGLNIGPSCLLYSLSLSPTQLLVVGEDGEDKRKLNKGGNEKPGPFGINCGYFNLFYRKI
jgi:hypothetical protein